MAKSKRDEELLDVAGRIAEGQPVHWDDLSDTLPRDAQDLLPAFRDIADVAAAHRISESDADPAGEKTPSTPVGRWGHLTLVEKIGEGSHAEVYRAFDATLEREVALKLLHRDASLAESAFDVIKREGKHLARVRHPNVANVYGVDEHDGRVGIWMELIRGRPLSELVREQGALGPTEAGLVGIEIAKAVAAIHGQGLIHRDIKASNVIREEGGRFVLADFGIVGGADAKLELGTPQGTPLYMSPEVLAGAPADRASDLYAIGVLLFYLVTRKFPFDASDLTGLRRAQERNERKLLREERPELPRSFARVIDRALSSDPGERFATATQLEDALAESLGLSTTPMDEDVEALGDARERHRPWKRWAAAGVAVALAATAMYFLRTDRVADIRIAQILPLTSDPGLEESPSWSPDGSRIAYAGDRTGNMDVWIRQVGVGESVNLTEDHEGFDGRPVWSPDGNRIAFLSDRDGGGIFIAPSVGGVARLAARVPFSTLVSFCWSPDGSRLAYTERDAGGGLYTIPIGGEEPVEIVPPNAAWALSDPAWSSETNRIAYTALTGGTGVAGTTVSAIWTVGPDGGDRVQVTDGQFFTHSPAWSTDGDRMFFISNREGGSDVWWLPVDSKGAAIGAPRQLTADAGVGGFAVSEDETRLVYSRVSQRSNIWSAPRVTAPFTLDDTSPVTSENHLIGGFDATDDGDWVVFDSNRAGNVDIWVMRRDGSELRPLTSSPSHEWNPRLSPDETRVAFHALRSGNRDIVTTALTGGPERQLTQHPAEDGWPYWSPHGDEIVFMSNREVERFELWAIAADGGDPRRLTMGGGQFPLWSPDGERIAFASQRTGSTELFLVSPDAGSERQLTELGWQAVVPGFWTEDGATIYAFGIGGHNSKGSALWAIDASDGSGRAILRASDGSRELTWGLAGDDDSIYFALVERSGDLRIAEITTEPS